MSQFLSFLNDFEEWLRRRKVPRHGWMEEELEGVQEGLIGKFWGAGLLVAWTGERKERLSIDQVADAILKGDFCLAIGCPEGASILHPEIGASLRARKGEGGQCGAQWKKAIPRIAAPDVTIVPASLVLGKKGEEFTAEEMAEDDARFEAAVSSGEHARVERMLRPIRREEKEAYRQRRTLRQCCFCRERFFWQRGRQRDCEKCRELSPWYRHRTKRDYPVKRRGPSSDELEELGLLRDIGYSPAGMAEWFGKSIRTVYRWLKQADHCQ